MTRTAIWSMFMLLSLAGFACGRVTLDAAPDGGSGNVVGGAGEVGSVGGAAGAGGAGAGGGATVDCGSLDESSCRLHASDCRVDGCPTCYGMQTFICSRLDAAPPLCVAPPCAPLRACAQETARATCDVRPDCHSVFSDNAVTCDCAPAGCSCLTFLTCADGDRARCQAPPNVCKSIGPFCGPGYTIAYGNVCYEGCVALQDCDVPPGTPSP